MSYHTEHLRLAPVLQQARKWDIATNPAPEAIFEDGSSGFQIWCTPDDHPKGWDGVQMTAGAFAKSCEFVASAWWEWEGDVITHVALETDAYALQDAFPNKYRSGKAIRSGDRYKSIHNRPADITWAKKKIRWLFKQAKVPCPPIRVG